MDRLSQTEVLGFSEAWWDFAAHQPERRRLELLIGLMLVAPTVSQQVLVEKNTAVL